MSVVSYDLSQGEEPFLSCTWPRIDGPPLLRKGEGPPEMHVLDQPGNVVTTHPLGLRLGTWLVLRDRRAADRKEIADALEAKTLTPTDRKVLERMLAENKKLKAHDEVFQARMPGYQLTGMQGCGDLTMNEWNVAFVDSLLTEKANTRTVIALRDEDLARRRYTCLVKWKNGKGAPRLSIEEVKFTKDVKHANNMVFILFRGAWLPRGASIDFAVSNQQVIREGAIVSAVASGHQFGDLRHLLQMPNLNPDRPLYPGEPGPPFRPRDYFGGPQVGDIWLGEEFLLTDRINVLRAALAGPITMPLPSGCTHRQLRGALQQSRYEEVFSQTTPLFPGQWRITDLTEKENNIEIHFRRNTYAWSMLGLTKDKSRLLSLACSGFPGETGFTLEEAANKFLDAGAWDALLIDEGVDVFHRIRDGSDFVEPVPLRRTRLRSVFLFAKPFARGGSRS
jgi:hypothetical protein